MQSGGIDRAEMNGNRSDAIRRSGWQWRATLPCTSAAMRGKTPPLGRVAGGGVGGGPSGWHLPLFTNLQQEEPVALSHTHTHTHTQPAFFFISYYWTQLTVRSNFPPPSPEESAPSIHHRRQLNQSAPQFNSSGRVAIASAWANSFSSFHWRVSPLRAAWTWFNLIIHSPPLN